MRFMLRLELDWSDGTIQRLIGLIERRGFEIAGMEVLDMGDVRQVDVSVKARTKDRAFDVLCRQIDRLYGLTRVDAGDSAPQPNLRFPLVG